jgi:hypothetical protein
LDQFSLKTKLILNIRGTDNPPIFKQLIDEECQYAFFQDHASAHKARLSTDALREVTGDRIISQNLW